MSTHESFASSEFLDSDASSPEPSESDPSNPESTALESSSGESGWDSLHIVNSYSWLDRRPSRRTPQRTITVLEELDNCQWRERECEISQAYEGADDALTYVILNNLSPRVEQAMGMVPTEQRSRVFLQQLYRGRGKGGLASWTCMRIHHMTKNRVVDLLPAAVYVEWNVKTSRQLVVFVDVPVRLKAKLQELITLTSNHGISPFVWHLLFVEQEACIVYNSHVGVIRFVVERSEKVCSHFNYDGYNGLYGSQELRKLTKLDAKWDKLPYNAAKFIMHLREALEAAEHTIQAIILEIGRWTTDHPNIVGDNILAWSQIRQDFLLVANEYYSHALRLGGLRDRNQNTINLALNISGRNTRTDSATMRTIAILSLVYLPGTFVSGLFGTNFFNLSTDDTGPKWTMSDNFWLYWAITVPLTTLTIVFWAYPTLYQWLRQGQMWLYRIISGLYPTKQTKPSSIEMVDVEPGQPQHAQDETQPGLNQV
ncbi:hypothetical protein BDW59DRAFT_155855 [Aspergillus cavernicola]|uniref:Uncharacterized protein n=1 Tax=Aspergillus cavernicola TaxID=176166 RepID=A0ABR4J569_9EURO